MYNTIEATKQKKKNAIMVIIDDSIIIRFIVVDLSMFKKKQVGLSKQPI